MSYRKLEPIQPPPPNPEGEVIGLAGGFNGGVTPKEGPLPTSPSLNAVRFQLNSVRRDFGFQRVGTPALSRLLAIGEHKFVRNDSTFHRFVRLRRSFGQKLVLEVWVGSEWVFVGESDEDIDEVMISTVSMQGAYLMAEGNYIFIWEETLEIVLIGQDFPAGNLVTGIGDSTFLVVDPGNAINKEYKVSFSVKIVGASQFGIQVVIGLVHQGEVIATKTLVSEPALTPFTEQIFENQFFEIKRDLLLNDALGLRLISIDPGGGAYRAVNFTFDEGAGPPVEMIATRTGDAVAYQDRFVFHYSMEIGTEGIAQHFPLAASVIFYVKPGGVGDWIQVGFHNYQVALGQSTMFWNKTFEVIRDDLGENSEFRMVVEDLPPTDNQGVLPFFSGPQPFLQWNEVGIDVGAELHGYNQEDDYDPAPGLEYRFEGNAVSIIEVVSPDAPGGRFIAEFADRLVALRDGGDPHSFAWSASGLVRDWIGVGSGQLFLVSSSSDPIDALMSFATLSSNVGALFRARSIMRVFPTGNPLQALGVIKWLEGVGTESPFSVQNVEKGIIFLGHNLMVYFLSEQGLQPIGLPIHQELIRTVTSNLELVDAAWDPIFNEYILGVPEANASNVTKLWYFDVRRFLDGGELVWRSRERATQRLATVSTI